MAKKVKFREMTLGSIYQRDPEYDRPAVRMVVDCYSDDPPVWLVLKESDVYELYDDIRAIIEEVYGVNVDAARN